MRALGFVGSLMAGLLMMVVAGQALAQTRPYDLAGLQPAVRSTVENARAAQTTAIQAMISTQFGQAGTISFTGHGGDTYFGEGYRDGSGANRNGYGLLAWSDGEYYAGQHRTGGDGGQKHGFGVYVFATGLVYEGEFRNDTYNGLGVLWDEDGQVRHAGRWRDGQPVN